jgi:hypothetical protein
MGISDLLQAVFDVIIRSVITPLFTDTQFAKGFMYGLVVAGIGGFIGMKVAYWRGKIKFFFNATKLPATRDGPTPVGILRGCVGATIKLAFLAGFIALIGSGMLRSCAM